MFGKSGRSVNLTINRYIMCRQRAGLAFVVIFSKRPAGHGNGLRGPRVEDPWLTALPCIRSEILISNIYFVTNFSAPWTMPHRAVAPLATPLYKTEIHMQQQPTTNSYKKRYSFLFQQLTALTQACWRNPQLTTSVPGPPESIPKFWQSRAEFPVPWKIHPENLIKIRVLPICKLGGTPD
jgi:hypothetical protein